MLSGLWDRYKLVLAGLAVAYPGFKPAWRWLVSVVDWLARYDFVVSSAGGAWTMLEAIFDPPLGLVFFVSLVGLGIMYLDFARTPTTWDGSRPKAKKQKVIITIALAVAVGNVWYYQTHPKQWEWLPENRTALRSVLDLPLSKFDFFILPLPSDTGAVGYGENLTGEFREAGWMPIFGQGNFVTAGTKGITVVYADNWKGAGPPQSALNLHAILKKAGLPVGDKNKIRGEGTITVLEAQMKKEGSAGVVIGRYQ